MDDGKHPSKCKWFNLSVLANFMLALIVLSLITKNEEIKMWIKARHVPNKGGEMFPKRKSIFQRGKHADSIKSTYERRVAKWGRNKGGIMVLGGGQAVIG